MLLDPMHRDDEALCHLRMAVEALFSADSHLLKASARYASCDGAHHLLKVVSDLTAIASNNANALAMTLGAATRAPVRVNRLYSDDDANSSLSRLDR